MLPRPSSLDQHREPNHALVHIAIVIPIRVAGVLPDAPSHVDLVLALAGDGNDPGRTPELQGVALDLDLLVALDIEQHQRPFDVQRSGRLVTPAEEVELDLPGVDPDMMVAALVPVVADRRDLQVVPTGLGVTERAGLDRGIEFILLRQYLHGKLFGAGLWYFVTLFEFQRITHLDIPL